MDFGTCADHWASHLLLSTMWNSKTAAKIRKDKRLLLLLLFGPYFRINYLFFIIGHKAVIEVVPIKKAMKLMLYKSKFLKAFYFFWLIIIKT